MTKLERDVMFYVTVHHGFWFWAWFAVGNAAAQVPGTGKGPLGWPYWAFALTCAAVCYWGYQRARRRESAELERQRPELAGKGRAVVRAIDAMGAPGIHYGPVPRWKDWKKALGVCAGVLAILALGEVRGLAIAGGWSLVVQLPIFLVYALGAWWARRQLHRIGLSCGGEP